MWTWTTQISKADVASAKANSRNTCNVPVVCKASPEERYIVGAAVTKFFAPERLGLISQSEFVDEVKSITPVEDGYEVKCIIRGD